MAREAAFKQMNKAWDGSSNFFYYSDEQMNSLNKEMEMMMKS